MKKITAGILILMLMLLSMPGMAVAGESPKQAFINYYTDYFAQSMQLQQQVLNALTTDTVQLRANADLKDFNMVLDDGTAVSNVSGNASLLLDFSLAQGKGSCSFQSKMLEYDIQGQVYIRGDEIIVTRETIQSLSNAGADFSELGNPGQLPPYIVFPLGLNEPEQAGFNMALKQSITYQEEQMQGIQDLLVEILEIIPDSCYSYDQNYAVLDLTRIAKDPQQLLNNLKSHSESLSDKVFGTFMSYPSLQSDPQFETQMMQARNEMVAAINNLTIADLNEFQKSIPFTLKKGKLYASADRHKASVEITGEVENNDIGFALNSEVRLSGDAMASIEKYDLSIHTSDFKLVLNLSADSSINPNQAACKMTLSGQWQEGKDIDDINSVSGKVNLDMDLDWSGNGNIVIPPINAQNSKRVEPDNNNQSIQVYLDGEKISLYGAEPIVSNGRTLIPVAVLTAALGGSTEWQPPDTIVLSNGSENQLVMRLNSTSYKIGAQEYTMDAPPVVQDGRTYVPVRVIAEYFGLSVYWDADNRIVYLNRQ